MVMTKLIVGLMFMWSTTVVFLGLFVAIVRRNKQKEPLQASKYLKFGCLICAHNEEKVIHRPIESLLKSDYPKDKFEIVVFADNCADKTAEIARSFKNVRVLEKTVPSSGKGDVLEWGINIVRKDDYEVLAVIDADNQVDEKWMSRLNTALVNGADIVTGHRVASNPFTNLITQWYALYWNLMNELSNRVRSYLGLSSMLTGTGFAFKVECLPEFGWKTKTFVEDLEFAFQQNVRGRTISYVSDAVFYDEQPISMKPMLRQLNRWATGGMQIMRRYGWTWIKALVRNPSARVFDCFGIISLGITGLALLILNIIDQDYVMLGFFTAFSYASAILATALSRFTLKSLWKAIVTFPIFVLILSWTVFYSLIFPQRSWKPIAHGN